MVTMKLKKKDSDEAKNNDDNKTKAFGSCKQLIVLEKKKIW